MKCGGMTDEPTRRSGPQVRASDGAARFDINEVSAATGLTVRNLRAYLQMGVLHPAEKRGRSLWFDHSHLRRINEIDRMRERGYSLAAIADILSADGTALTGDDLEVMTTLIGRWRTAPPTWSIDAMTADMAPDERAEFDRRLARLREAAAAVAEAVTTSTTAQVERDPWPAVLLALGTEAARTTTDPSTLSTP